MGRAPFISAIILIAALAVASATAKVPERSDVDAARSLFRANLDAIRHRDRAAYLACYLQSDSLARTGPEGAQLGYQSLADQRDAWPDLFEGTDLKLVPVKPGIVYGTYRYRVRYGPVEQSGLSERFFIDTPKGWKIAVTTAFPAPAGTPPPPRALVGATLIDGTGAPPMRDAVIVLRNGKVECAGPRASCPLPSGVDTVDARGLWITPGLVDAHVHYSQTGWADGRPDALDLRARFPYEQTERELRMHPERFHRAYLGSGVTAVFDVGGYPWTLDLQESSKDDLFAPHYQAAGPLLSTLDHWLNLPAERQFIYMANDSVTRAGVRFLKARGASAVKVWFIPNAPRPFDEMEKLVAVAGDEARKVHLPLIVHATGLREAKAALRAGANLLVHSVWDTTVDDEFIQLAKRNRTIYCPTITVIDGYTRMDDAARSGKPPDVDDFCGCLDSLTLAHVASTPAVAKELYGANVPSRPARPERRRFMDQNLLIVQRAGIPIAMGTDAGNPLTLHGISVHAEMEAMQQAGMKPMDVIVASTRGGAMAMGRLDEFGTIEKGKAADLLVLDADPLADVKNLRHIRYVVRGGVVRRPGEFRQPH